MPVVPVKGLCYTSRMSYQMIRAVPFLVAASLSAAFAAAPVRNGAVEYKLDAASSTRSLPDDPRYDLRPGLKMSCRVKFDVHPSEKGQMTLLQKGHANAPGSFWLRVDGGREKVAFSFFVNLGNGPEPRVSVLGRPDGTAATRGSR